MGTPGSHRFTIRAAEPGDAEAISALIGSQGVFDNTLQMPYAAPGSRVERFTHTDANSVRVVAVDRSAASGSDNIAGFASLSPVNSSPRCVHVRGLAIAVGAPWQGQGVGHPLMVALLDWADNWAGVLRIELCVYTDNERAIRLYKHHGFVQEGVLRAHALRNGAYADSLLMARLHPRQALLANV